MSLSKCVQLQSPGFAELSRQFIIQRSSLSPLLLNCQRVAPMSSAVWEKPSPLQLGAHLLCVKAPETSRPLLVFGAFEEA